MGFFCFNDIASDKNYDKQVTNHFRSIIKVFTVNIEVVLS